MAPGFLRKLLDKAKAIGRGFVNVGKKIITPIAKAAVKYAPIIGGAVGSIVPGLGTAAGTAIGGAISAGGRALGIT